MIRSQPEAGTELVGFPLTASQVSPRETRERKGVRGFPPSKFFSSQKRRAGSKKELLSRFEKVITSVSVVSDEQFDRQHRKRFIIYPGNKYRVAWELYINFLLLVISFLTPLQLAFGARGESQSQLPSTRAVNYFVDACFLLDVVLSFFSASENQFHEVMDDRKAIAVDYLKGWFTIDVLSIFPFELLATEDSGSSDFNQFLRLARIGRLYKLVKLTKLIRLAKIIKNQRLLMEYIQTLFKVSLAIKRLLFFLLIFFILCHITACLFIMMPEFSDEGDAAAHVASWLDAYLPASPSDQEVYWLALYWTITTITTVGYGDISGKNGVERLYCIAIMLAGAISFSFVNGTLASIVSSMDTSSAQHREQLERLHRIDKQYSIPPKLLLKMRKSGRLLMDNKYKEVETYLSDLPHKLRTEASLLVYKDLLSAIQFLHEKPVNFLTWISPRLRPVIFDELEPVYVQGDVMHQVYFLSKGRACYVVPSINYRSFGRIREGRLFGISDLIMSWRKNHAYYDAAGHFDFDNIKRIFSVIARSSIECLALSRDDLQIMQNVWPSEFSELYADGYEIVVRALRKRIKTLDAFLRNQNPSTKGDHKLASRPFGATLRFASSIAELNLREDDGEGESSDSSDAEDLSHVKLETLSADTIALHKRVYQELQKDLNDFRLFEPSAAVFGCEEQSELASLFSKYDRVQQRLTSLFTEQSAKLGAIKSVVD